MARFTFDTDCGRRTVVALDEQTARTQLEALLYHPDPAGSGSEPYTAEQVERIRRERAARAAALHLVTEEKR
ncbi:hypothetical protein [Streptosporangium sp. NPDC051022]|uniref:hypothetical protein n=1 Tax=Streptosporangium sp. NPDC051022 TaxID=3155752 RepID=UPI0034400E96